MYIKTKLIKIILNNPNNILLENITYLDLYENMCKVLNYLNYRNINKIRIINPLSNYYTVLIIFCSLFKNLNVYMYGLNNFDSEKISNCLDITDIIVNKILDNKDKPNLKIINIKDNTSGEIFYEINKSISKVSWEKINIFYKGFRKIFSNLIDKHEVKNICITNLNDAYMIYFLPLILTYKIPLNLSSEEFIISDDSSKFKKQGIFIGTKLTFNYPTDNIFSLFFSYTLNQFILYNIFIDNDKLIGNLLPFLKIELFEDSKLLLYNGNKIRIPKSYTVISNKVISIKQKSSKLIKKNIDIRKIDLPHSKYFYVNNNFSKLIFLNSKIHINKTNGFKIYKILITKFNNLNSKNYVKMHLQNFYLYNQVHILENSLFSLFIKTNSQKSTIIIHLSKILFNLEREIILEIDSILNKLSNCKDIIINSSTKSIGYIYGKIHIISEIKFFIKVIIRVLPPIIKKIF